MAKEPVGQVGKTAVSFSKERELKTRRRIHIARQKDPGSEARQTKTQERWHLRDTAMLLRPFLERADLATVAYDPVTSGLGYCNAFHVGLPLERVEKRQRVQKATARLLTRMATGNI